MASIFLVNDNKIVSRLLQLSSEKHGYLLEEKMEIEPSREHYDFVLIDSDKYSPEIIEALKSKITFGKLGYIGVKKETVPPEFDMHLDKPFLPSDFVSMIEENMNTVQEEETILSEEVDLENETLSMEVEDKLGTTEETIDLDTEEELEALKELEDFEELEDFSLDELDTPEEAPKTETAEEGALKDIEKTEDALKELDALDEELEDLDLSLDAGAVMSTGIAEQYLDESAEDQTEEHEEPDEPSDEASKVAIGAAVSAAAAAGAAMLHEEEKEEKHEEPLPKAEEELSSLDTLEGSEALEHESDYLEEEITTEELANEFDTLNEEEVMKALNTNEEAEETSSEPEVQAADETNHETVPQAVAEEIIHEEIAPEGEETLVESNDVEKWIRDAVANAITPEMIKEALDGMEINVTLNFTKKES